MGFFDSTSSTKNYNTDNRAVADGGSHVVTGNGQMTINQQSVEALALAQSAIAGTLTAAQTATQNASNLANRAINNSQSDITEMMKLAIPAAAFVVAVFVLKKGKSK